MSYIRILNNFRLGSIEQALKSTVLGLVVAAGVWARADEATPAPAGQFFIKEYRVKGAHALGRLEIENTVYRFLGPARTEADVRAACDALEKLYREKGYGAATVQYSSESTKKGVVLLLVQEGTVAKLRVKGAKYFSPVEIRKAAPSLREGRAINFNDVNQDMVALNQLPDRRVLPALKPGTEPGSYDVDLEVQDKAPVHASLEVNNRNSPNTKPLRVSASVSDSNLWQAGHGAGLSFQVAPQRRQDSEVLSGYYLARFPGLDRTTFMVQATKQNSNISTLGGTTVAGPGQTVDLSATVRLPNGRNWGTGQEWSSFSHSLSFGITYKHFKQTITPGGSAEDASGTGRIVRPITYYPLHVDYSAAFADLLAKGSSTDLNLVLNFHLRGIGSGPSEFNANRYGSDGNFVYVRGEVAHTQDIWLGLQVYGKAGGQLSNQPLVSSEQISGGGLTSARGYLEAQAVGDDGAYGTLELRSPSVLGPWRTKTDVDAGKDAKGQAATRNSEWRFHIFGDACGLTLHDSLPKQKARFGLVSVGIGTRLLFRDFASASLDAGYPIYTLGQTKAGDTRVTFRASVSY